MSASNASEHTLTLQTLDEEFIRPLTYGLEIFSQDPNFPKTLAAIRPPLAKAGAVYTTAKARQNANLDLFRNEWTAKTETCRNFVLALQEADEETLLELYKDFERTSSSGSIYANFLAMLTFFADFARTETTAECDELRRDIARLEKQFGREDKTEHTRNDSSANYASSYHFQNSGGPQYTNTGSGHQFNGSVYDPSFGGK